MLNLFEFIVSIIFTRFIVFIIFTIFIIFIANRVLHILMSSFSRI